MTELGATASDARRWAITGLLFVAGFINYLDRAIISVALPVVALDLHLGPVAKGVLLSAFFWPYGFMQLLVGWLSDRYSLRWLYAGAFALWSLACGFTGLVSTLGMLVVLRTVMGVGESIYLPGGMKAVSLFFDAKERGLASGLVNSGTRAGLALGAPLIAMLVSGLGWKSTFLGLGFGGMVWVIPWLRAYPVHTPPVSVASKGEAGRLPNWIDRNLLALCGANFCYAYYWYLLVTWLPDYLVISRHLSLRRAGAYAAVPYLIYMVSEPLGGWIADLLVRFGWTEMRSRKVVITGAFLSSLLFLPVGFVANDVGAIMLIGGAAMVGLATGNMFALLQRVAPPGEVGLWTGFMSFAGNLSGIVEPIVTGFLIARTHSYYPGFVVSVAVLLSGLPFFGRWILRDRKEPVVSETR